MIQLLLYVPLNHSVSSLNTVDYVNYFDSVGSVCLAIFVCSFCSVGSVSYITSEVSVGLVSSVGCHCSCDGYGWSISSISSMCSVCSVVSLGSVNTDCSVGYVGKRLSLEEMLLEHVNDNHFYFLTFLSWG